MTLIATPQQTSGPLFGFALLYPGCEQAIDPSDEHAVTIEGRVTDGIGLPLQWEAELEFWAGDQLARARTMDDGHYSVTIREPEGSSRNGKMLAPFVNVLLFGRGLNGRLDTRLYFPDEADANAADPVLSLVPRDRCGTLVAQATNEPGRLRFDIVLQGERETVFFTY